MDEDCNFVLPPQLSYVDCYSAIIFSLYEVICLFVCFLLCRRWTKNLNKNILFCNLLFLEWFKSTAFSNHLMYKCVSFQEWKFWFIWKKKTTTTTAIWYVVLFWALWVDVFFSLWKNLLAVVSGIIYCA